jgi:monoamine oxidase
MRVLVAGAGLAGLTAARDLEASGAEVTVVEARDRVGGRVHTIRDGFEGAQHAEAGADLIESEQTHVLDLVRELDLKPVRILRHGWGFYGADSRGRLRIRSAPGSFAEAAKRLEQEIRDYRLAGRDWDSPVVAMIARQSVSDWLARVNSDAGFASAVTGLRGFFLADPEDLSLIALVDEFASGDTPGEARMFRIPEGNDRLTTALARTLRKPVLLQCVVKRVAQTDSGVRITVEGRRQEVLDADYAVLTLPATTLRDVTFDPPLPPQQSRAIAHLRYGTATRVLLQFETRFWRRPGRPSAFGTDQQIGAVWDGNEQQAHQPGILSLLAGGRASAGVRSILSSGGTAELIDRLRWLGSPSELLTHRVVPWEDDPWSKGGYAFFDPSFPPTLRDWLARAFGRLAFAGEHTSAQSQGYMNGAIESGKRAAAEVRAMRAITDLRSRPRS